MKAPLFVTSGTSAANSGGIAPAVPMTFDTLAASLAYPMHVGKLTLAEYLAFKAAKDERAVQDKDSRWFSLATFKGGRRLKENVTALAGFVGDLDEGNHTLEQIQAKLAGVAHIVFTTYSNSAAHPKFRVVVPYAQPIAPADHRRLFDWFNATMFDGALDTAASDTSRLSYCPSCCADQEAATRFEPRPGVYFDPVPVLAALPVAAPNAPKSDGLTTDVVWPVTHPDPTEAIAARRAAYPEFDALERGESTDPDASANDARLVWHLLQCFGGNGQAVFDYLMESDPPHPMKRAKWDRRLADDICTAFDKLHALPTVNVASVGFGQGPAPAGMSLVPIPKPAASPAPVVVEVARPALVVPIDWSILRGEPPARTWLLPDWIGAWPTLVSGAGGAGKTRIMQALATSLATGTDYIGKPGQPLSVLMWFCEDSQEEIWRQQIAINSYLKVSMSQLGGLHIVPRFGHDNTLLELVYSAPQFTGLLELLREQVNDLKADVLVLDNLAQVFGCNESDRHQTTMFVNGIAGLVKDRPFAPVFLGHVARSIGSEYSGSAAWENAVRMRMYVGPNLPDVRPEADDGPVLDSSTVYLAKRKANYAPKDWRRLTFQNGLFVPEAVAEGQAITPRVRNETMDRLVMEAFRKLVGMGTLPTDVSNGTDYLPKQIANKRLMAGYSKKEIAESMHRLMTDGKLKRGEVPGANRHPRKVLVAT